MKITNLDGLSVLPKDVHSDNSLVEGRVCGLDNVIVKMFLIAEGVKALEDELKEGLQVFRGRRGDKDVRIAKSHRACNGQTQGSRFPTTPARCQGYGGAQGLLRNGLNKRQNCFGLIIWMILFLKNFRFM
jgi:hypothetical protein